MDASYMVSGVGSEMDFNGMFDQYMHKVRLGGVRLGNV